MIILWQLECLNTAYKNLKSLYNPLVEERGKLQGKIEALLSVLTVIVGNMPDDLVSRIRNASINQIEDILTDIPNIKEIGFILNVTLGI